MPKAKAAAAKALEIDSSLAEAHISLAYASFTYDWDWAAAISHFDRALALNREAVLNHSYYRLLSHGCRPLRGSRERRATRLGPRSGVRRPSAIPWRCSWPCPGISTKGSTECRRTIELDPAFAVAYDVLGMALASKGMYREALPEIEKAVALTRGARDTDGRSRLRACPPWSARRSAADSATARRCVEGAIHAGHGVRNRSCRSW